MGFLGRLQTIDRRIMYIALVIVVALPLIAKMVLPVAVTPEVQGFYDTVNGMNPNKLAVISAMWGSGTSAENGPQTEAVIRHFFKTGKHFALLAWDQQGATLLTDLANKVAKEMHKQYGVDYVNWGYRPYYPLQIGKGLSKDVWKTVGKDSRATPIGEIPVMKNIRTADDIGIWVEVTATGSVADWISYLPKQVVLVYCPTAVMVPEGYNYLDAGLVKGMLPGLIGAAEYESLINYKGGSGMIGASALSTSHLLIIALMLLGNLGYFLSIRRREER